MQEQPRQLSACWAEGPSEVLEQVELRSRGRTLDRGAVVVARPPGVGCDQLRLLGDEQVEMVQPVRQLAGGGRGGASGAQMAGCFAGLGAGWRGPATGGLNGETLCFISPDSTEFER
ncbi:hypothetical protein QQ054_14925 [Oscillatoria amoena NRMC-F 0135]|nr:hypothetical protein [Oscillatoria amoena NRMC-F 0135]